MANCHICKEPVTVGFVVCAACAGADKVQTNFELLTSSPEELAKWLDKIYSSRGYSFDMQYCQGDCGDSEECCQELELECIEKWLRSEAPTANKC